MATVLTWLIFSWYFMKYQEKVIIRPILTNSDGWSWPMPGTSIHRLALFTTLPQISTATRLEIHRPYIRVLKFRILW